MLYRLSSAVLFCTALNSAADWNQFRGPARDGISHETVPTTWPSQLKKVWTVDAGEGYASPIVSSGGVFVHARRGSEETVTRFDLTSGKVVWTKTYSAPFGKNQYALKMQAGPFSTPTEANGRLYTLGVTAILTCWDSKNGALIWRKDFSAHQDTSKLFVGTAMSPLVDGSQVIVHVGDDRGGTIHSYDTLTGVEKWTTKGDGPGYASPVIATFSGVRQFVTMTDRNLVGVSIADGKVLWAHPFKDEWIENIITPIVYKDAVVFTGVRNGSLALRPRKSASGWSAETVWADKDLQFYMSTPIADGDYLYGLSSRKKGQWVCADLRTGKVLWSTEGREAKQATVIGAGSNLLLFTDEGALIVARKSPKGFEQVRRYALSDSALYAHPVFLGKQLLVKDATALTLWQIE